MQLSKRMLLRNVHTCLTSLTRRITRYMSVHTAHLMPRTKYSHTSGVGIWLTAMTTIAYCTYINGMLCMCTYLYVVCLIRVSK